MTVWLYTQRGPNAPLDRINCETSPAPTVMAMGIGNVRDGQHYVESDGGPTKKPKPGYYVPSMAEIAAIEPNGYTVVSTFSGCGGSCLGMKMAGFRIPWASEFVPAAAEVYRLNHPGTILDTSDIRQVEADTIKALVGQIDVLEGSPPCAAFSTAGKRNRTWGKNRHYSDTVQQTDDLFFEFARLLKGLQPKAFVAENVSGLVKGVAKGYFLTILQELKDAGYVVEAKLLDASWLGVPQSRQRIIFQGLRKDLAEATGLKPRWPKPLDYQYTVRDALPWLMHEEKVIHDNQGDPQWSHGNVTDTPAPTITTRPNTLTVRLQSDGHGYYPGTDLDLTQNPAPTIPAGPNRAGFYNYRLVTTQRIQQHDVVGEDTAATLEGYATGKEWDKLKPGETSDKYLNLSKPHPDKPSPTITALGANSGGGAPGATGSVTHPTEKRKFTINELKRLCAFPDDFQLTGSYAQQWERLGRAVPPLMMKAIAVELAGLLKDVDHCVES